MIRRVTGGAIVALCLVYALLSPAAGQERFVDQVIYRETVQAMKQGDGYYPAMDHALRNHGGAVSNIRAFREPAMFLVWRWMPAGRATWLVFVALAAVTGFLLLGTTTVPVVVPLVVWYLLNAARPHRGGVWLEQDMLVELWVVPAVAGLLYAWRRGHDWAAAALAAFAVVVRELAAGLLVGGLAAAVVGRRRRAPWLVALATGAAAYGLHNALAHSHLVAHGHQIELLGSGGVRRAATMMGVALPWPLVVGPVLWILAVVRVATDRDLRLVFGLYVMLPLTGLLVGRDYWGFLVTPFLIVWAAEAAKHMFDHVTTTT